MDEQKEQKKELILSWICMVLGILSVPMICYWYVGLALAAGSIALGVFVTRRYKRNRKITVGLVCAGGYLVFFLIVAIFLGIYYNIINLHK